jgi:hypothetical protein
MDQSFYARKAHRLSRLVLQSLVPFSVGLTVTEGDFISSDLGSTLWIAQNSGTSGATAPTIANGRTVQIDGSILWQPSDLAILARYVFQAPPQPT